MDSTTWRLHPIQNLLKNICNLRDGRRHSLFKRDYGNIQMGNGIIFLNSTQSRVQDINCKEVLDILGQGRIAGLVLLLQRGFKIPRRPQHTFILIGSRIQQGLLRKKVNRHCKKQTTTPLQNWQSIASRSHYLLQKLLRGLPHQQGWLTIRNKLQFGFPALHSSGTALPAPRQKSSTSVLVSKDWYTILESRTSTNFARSLREFTRNG